MTNSQLPRVNPRIVIIGAGMAGILTAIKLREAGYDDYVIYEKSDRVKAVRKAASKVSPRCL